LCRLGSGLGTDFFHCMKCNCCLGIKMIEHKCREKMLEMNCPICCDFLVATSCIRLAFRYDNLVAFSFAIIGWGKFCLILIDLILLFQAYTCTHYTCPICCKSLGDMTVNYAT
jgi:zinc finger-like protein